MPRSRIHAQAPALSASASFRAFVLADLALILWVLVDAITKLAQPDVYNTTPYALQAAWAGVTALADLWSLGLWALAMVWRRRLAFVAVVGALWRPTHVVAVWMQVGVIVWGALVWWVFLREGRRMALAVSEATGEEVLGADPERPDR